MFPEMKIGCIAEAFRLMEENHGEGSVFWVPHVGHAYYLHPNRAALNLGDNGYRGYPNYTKGELLEFFDAGKAKILKKRRSPKR